MNGVLGDNFLFIHIMKTGGTSLAEVIAHNFPEPERYPESSLAPDAEAALKIEAYTHVPRVIEGVNNSDCQYRVVRAHIPYAITTLLNTQFTTITLLRDPVARTLSYLKHCKKFHVEHRDKSLEEIYEDEWYFKTFMGNYQTKLFSMTAEECLSETRLGDRTPELPPRAAFIKGQPIPAQAVPLHSTGAARFALELFSPATAVIQVDEERLTKAKAALEQIELVGITEHFELFLTALKERFGWNITHIPQRNTGDRSAVNHALRQRIANDCSLDMELYEFARGLCK